MILPIVPATLLLSAPFVLDTDDCGGIGQQSVPQHCSLFLQVQTICFGRVPFGKVACARAWSGDGVVGPPSAGAGGGATVGV